MSRWRLRRDDAGVGPLGVIVSLLFVGVIAAPIALSIVHGSRASKARHAITEADGLAWNYVQQQVTTPNAAVPLQRVAVTHTDRIGENTYTTTVAVEQEFCSGASCQPVCGLPNGSSLAEQVSTTTAAVTWVTTGSAPRGSSVPGSSLPGGAPPGSSPPDGFPRGPVSMSTDLVPAGADISGLGGEIAVPVLSPAGMADRSDTVSLVVDGHWVGRGPAPTVSADQTTHAEASDLAAFGASGCVVFTNLDPQPGFSYTVSAVSCHVAVLQGSCRIAVAGAGATAAGATGAGARGPGNRSCSGVPGPSGDARQTTGVARRPASIRGVTATTGVITVSCPFTVVARLAR
jgi:hypothetical protein